MAIVIGLILLLSLSGGLLAATAMQHDPLVSNDVVQHLAYRALESGIDSYVAALNASPNLVNCNSNNTSPSSAVCPSSQVPALDNWIQVKGNGNNPVSEYFMWTNPALCFNNACTAPGGTAGQTLQYVKELVYGAAVNGTTISYQTSYLQLTPENGFLTHIWWSNYESTVPAQGYTSSCTYDWNDDYQGPDTTEPGNFNSSNCSAVYFGPNDVLYGPVYSNDSIYVAKHGPNFGSQADPSTVTTHDPNCLFVAPPDNADPQSCSGASADVGYYNSSASSYNAALEPLPSTDASLETIAAQNGCVYSGPTQITLDAQGTTEYMTVTSPDTPFTTSSGTVYNSTGGVNQDLAPYNKNSCGAGGSSTVAVPTNGVVFIENVAGSCPNSSQPSAYDYYANPFDGVSGSGTDSQLGYYYGQTSTPDCEGDAFVSGALTGTLTIATQNDIEIDGNITYTDCGAGFDSTFANQCTYNSSLGAPNDALGLIAFAYVGVNRPVEVSQCQGQWCGGYGGNVTVLASCGSQGALPAPLCDPSSGSGVVIDAAILALNDGFGVNNYEIPGSEGTLDVYGSISQDYRPAVGEFSGDSVYAGYSKYYLWDSRLGYVNVPYYLNPGTPRWAIASTAVAQGVACSGVQLPGYWTPSTSYPNYATSPGSCTAP
ncbi:MAG: hypothetical protein ACRDVP_00585 [Acidimicrobiales bacterium]